MKKFSLAAAMLFLVSLVGFAQSQPAKETHGQNVSAVAKETPAGPGHGQTVKAAATDNNGQDKKGNGKKRHHGKHHGGKKKVKN